MYVMAKNPCILTHMCTHTHDTYNNSPVEMLVTFRQKNIQQRSYTKTISDAAAQKMATEVTERKKIKKSVKLSNSLIPHQKGLF